jgi:hypothetical protein
VEGRLDSLVGVETQKKEEAHDQSKVISEIEKSFTAIFGDSNKEVNAEISENNNTDEVQFIPPTVEEIILKAEQADIQSINRTPAELVSPDSVPYSQLNDIRSIIQSLEWEISDGTLDLLDAELNKLHTLNEENSTILGFLQIIRFLGRYIRVRGSGSNRAAIALLLSVYDNLEDVILSEDMTAENKHAVLLEDIRKYREWADQVDGVNELFDVKSEKAELDLFLSSIAGGKVTPATAIYTPDETLRSGESQYERTMSTKSTDYDDASTVRWDRAPSAIDNTSRMQSYEVDSNDQTGRFELEEITSPKITWIALIIVFLVLSITAAGFLWLYPERRNQALRWMVSNIPYTDRVLTIEKAQKNPDTGKIKFIDVRQRFVRNTAMGRNIRVVEGIVINNTAANLLKVKLTGELYDAEGLLLLLSKASLAGNVLTDDKLEKLDEDKIFSALSIAPASNLSEARITPLGEVPFMIVFTRDPPKVFKLVIIPILE